MTVFGVSDQGKIRKTNQDSFRLLHEAENDLALAVLCDGMGGAKGGEVASATAAEAFLRHASRALAGEDTPLLADVAREAAAYANLKVYDRASRQEEYRGMGTTLVAAIVRKEEAVVVNIGDSRCYWLAEEQLLQVTRDHSVVQDMVEQGLITAEEARSHPRRNLITRAAGLGRFVQSDLYSLDFRTGDRLLLCSDGLSNLVSRAELEDLLCRETDGQACCDRLLALALERGAPDNVTVVLLER